MPALCSLKLLVPCTMLLSMPETACTSLGSRLSKITLCFFSPPPRPPAYLDVDGGCGTRLSLSVSKTTSLRLGPESSSSKRSSALDAVDGPRLASARNVSSSLLNPGDDDTSVSRGIKLRFRDDRRDRRSIDSSVPGGGIVDAGSCDTVAPF